MAAATVPTPTVSIGGKNYYVGQSYSYQGVAVPAVYDENGNFAGFMSPQGTLFSGPPGAQPDPKITPIGPVTAAQAAAANQGSGSTASSFGVNPTITYGGPQTGAAQGEQPPDINYARAYLRQMGGASLTDTSFDAGVSDAQVMDFWNKQHPAPAQAATPAGPTIQPEQVALANMAQIDPASEALRGALGQSYLGQLGSAQLTPEQTALKQQLGQSYASSLAAQQALPQKAQPPSAADLQSYLNTYQQVDPTGAAGRSQLESALTSQAALGTQLDPETIREITQQTRAAQAARGNVYGTPQLVQEAMTRGQAGMAIQQQRQQALQSFLSSGQSTGDVALNLYQQGQAQYNQNLANLRAAQQGAFGYLNQGQANLQAAQQGATSYLTSPATPYAAGAQYVDRAEAAAANAAQGGAAYNPSQVSQSYQGAQLPQYGLDIGAQATNWYNSMVNQAGQQAAYSQPKSGGAGAAAGGALKGAASGALTGAAGGPWGALIGAGVGAIGGAAQSYFS
jgi:hypothetical protein